MTDEEKYIILMGKYKSSRGKLGPEANKYLLAASKIAKDGKIDHEIVLGSAYL